MTEPSKNIYIYSCNEKINMWMTKHLTDGVKHLWKTTLCKEPDPEDLTDQPNTLKHTQNAVIIKITKLSETEYRNFVTYTIKSCTDTKHVYITRRPTLFERLLMVNMHLKHQDP